MAIGFVNIHGEPTRVVACQGILLEAGEPDVIKPEACLGQWANGCHVALCQTCDWLLRVAIAKEVK